MNIAAILKGYAINFRQRVGTIQYCTTWFRHREVGNRIESTQFLDRPPITLLILWTHFWKVTELLLKGLSGGGQIGSLREEWTFLDISTKQKAKSGTLHH